ncbi:MAG TPA: hypothetical protein VFS19_06155 [Planctomycetota bacterium]|nr:hypothetical protein [Planctomycetota bacterium]
MNSSTERRSLILAVVIGIAVLAVAGVSVAGLRRVDRREQCLWNLSRVGMAVIAAEPANAAGWDRIGTGRRFFVDFADWPGPPPFPIDPRWFCCPQVGVVEVGRIDYRGPSLPLRGMDRNDPIAADRPGNHGSGEGGNVALRSGSVMSVSELDPAWTRAAATTSGN